MLDDRTDALFPRPDSDAGRLLAYLVSLQIPGTAIETSLGALAGGARMSLDSASRALAKLTDDGLILVEPGATTDLSATVLLAPPLDEYGISPQWTERAVPATLAQALLISPQEPTMTADPPPASPASPASPTSPARRPAGRPARPAAPAITRPAPVAESAGATSIAGLGSVTTESVTQPLPPATPRPARRTRPETAPPAAARRAEPAAAVDETALVRGFVERFERLLAEQDELRRRAQVAEERAASVEKLLRAAERRAETAESRLEQAQEKLRSWADLTKRMQQLSRQADSGGRSKLPAQRSA